MDSLQIEQAFHWACAQAGAGWLLRSASLLPGATSSTLYALELERAGKTRSLVLRLYTNQEWLEEDPGLPRHEAAALEKAAESGTPVPELVAYEESPTLFGVPAILMTRLPGSVVLVPSHMDDWLTGLAQAIYPLHQIDPGDFPWQYQPYNRLDTLQVPTWTERPALWERAIQIVQGTPPAFEPRFIHRDYHPNNVLWQNERVSGIVDWPNACRGCASIDLSWCRSNLVSLYGWQAADRFLQAYQSLAGPGFIHHPYWDLIVQIEVLPGPLDDYEGWLAFGIPARSADVHTRLTEDYLERILSLL